MSAIDRVRFSVFCEDCAPQWLRALPGEPWERVPTSVEGRKLPCNECGEKLGAYHWSIELPRRGCS